MGDKLSNIIDSSVAAIVGIVMVASAVIPIAVSQIVSLQTITDISESDLTMYQTLLGVAVIMVILSVVIGIVRYFSRSD